MSEYILFVAGRTAHSLAAITNLGRALTRLGLDDRGLEVVDVEDAPDLAIEMRVFVTPTLLRRDQPAAHRLIGDLSADADLLNFLK